MATTPQLRFRSTGLLHLAADQEGVKCLSTVDGEAEVLIKGIDYYEDLATAKRYANNSWAASKRAGEKPLLTPTGLARERTATYGDGHPQAAVLFSTSNRRS